jgi:hypothetical protein
MSHSEGTPYTLPPAVDDDRSKETIYYADIQPLVHQLLDACAQHRFALHIAIDLTEAQDREHNRCNIMTSALLSPETNPPSPMCMLPHVLEAELITMPGLATQLRDAFATIFESDPVDPENQGAWPIGTSRPKPN